MPRVQRCKYLLLSHPFQAGVLRAHKEKDSLPSSAPPFCPLVILGSGPSVLINCDKKVWREQVRLVPKALAAILTPQLTWPTGLQDKALLAQCCPLPFFSMWFEDLRQQPMLIAPSQLWHGGTPNSTDKQVEG